MDKRPLGVTIFGVGNIIIGLTNLIILFFPFLLVVIAGGVAYRDFYGPLDRFCSIVIDNFVLLVLYISSFLLFRSGVYMLRMKANSRKVSIFATSLVVLSILIWVLFSAINSVIYHKGSLNIDRPWQIIFYLFLFYAILLITYLNDQGIRKLFDDKEVKLPYEKAIYIASILFIYSLIWYLR